MITYEVGRYYRVPCVYVRRRGESDCRPCWVPIIGHEHDDVYIIGFNWKHTHVDWRFAGMAVFSMMNLWSGEVESGRCLGRVISDDSWQTIKGPEKRLRKCRRLMPRYPKAPWRQALEAAFASSQINLKNPICPHRGLPLAGCEREGIYECPGHGLCFSKTTGELVQRTVEIGATT